VTQEVGDSINLGQFDLVYSLCEALNYEAFL
jgi:hypothetical protein